MQTENKSTPGPWEFQKHDDHSRYYGNIIGYYSRYETDPEKGNQIRTITIQLKHGTEEENAANAELIARAPALLSEVETLREENARLKAECSSHEKERYEIYSFDSSQAMEIKALQKELEQLRSELDKLKSDCAAWKGMIVPILDFAQQHGKQLGIRPGESIPEKVLEILKSALSGGSKQ